MNGDRRNDFKLEGPVDCECPASVLRDEALDTALVPTKTPERKVENGPNDQDADRPEADCWKAR
jgi:hypothetical protein